MGLEAIVKGWTGELKTKCINHLFLDKEYRTFDNVLIPLAVGTTQIDHVIVSKYGVFAVETKDKTGWIFGDRNQDQWTQQIYGKKYKFQNPLRQNYRHTKSLAEFLKIDHSKIHSIVIFWGDCEFKTQMPDNVFKGGIFNGNYKHYLQSKSESILSMDEIERICSDLENAKKSAGFLSGFQHTRDLKRRYASETKCPKCGSDLIRRTTNKGPRAGNSFLGCSNFPRCHYIKDS